MVLLLVLIGCSGTTPPEPPTTPAEPEADATPQCGFDLLLPHLGGKALGETLMTSVPNVDPESTDFGDSTCMFYLMGWNNWLYLSGGEHPRFLSYAPWSFVDLTVNPAPPAYPTGPVALDPVQVKKYPVEAGDEWRLIGASGGEVLYDVRMNEVMYQTIIDNKLYCPDQMSNADGSARDWYFAPTSNDATADTSIEYKSSWLDFGSAEDCPQDELFCQGQYGLVGMHLAQKIPGHGEWIWWSFEYAGNSPDCAPTMTVGGQEVATTAPIDSRPSWLFFDQGRYKAGRTEAQIASNTCAVPSADQLFADSSLAIADICSGSTPTPSDRVLCNQNPLKDFTAYSTDFGAFVPVNVCRVDALPDAAASRAAGACVLSGSDDTQAPQLSCVNDEVSRGGVSVADGIAPMWFQNYVQIGAEWTNPGAPMDARALIGTSDDDSTTPVSRPKVGFPDLANTTMETWMQKGAITANCNPAAPSEVLNVEAMDCFACHTGNFPANEVEDGRQNYSHLLERVIGKNGGEQAACADLQ